MATMQINGAAGELKSPVRNRYYYGKLLDVHHFELEQEYFNLKRSLINQRVIGFGVVCGLDVILSQDARSVIVQPGLALDRCGREIIVGCPSAPISLDPWIKPAPATQPAKTVSGSPAPANPASPAPDDGKWVHLCLCFHECDTEPEPAFGGDCDSEARCASGAIRERYKIDICEGKVKPPQAICNLSGLFSQKTLDYAALARFISRSCMRIPDTCCIPLANIQFPSAQTQNPPQTQTPGSQYPPPIVDITIRPVVLTNPLLFQLMLCLCGSNGQTPCSETSY
jgi:hypothetical protein